VLKAASLLAEKLPAPAQDEFAGLVKIAGNLRDELLREDPAPARVQEIRETLDYLSGRLEEIDSTGGETEAEDLGRPADGVERRRQAAALAARARQQAAACRYDEAAELAREALAMDHYLLDARLVPAEIEIARGRDAEAAKLLFHVTEAGREQLERRQAESPFLKDKPFPLAFDFVQDADARAYGRALELSAGALLRLGRYEEAHRFSDEVAQLDPRSALFAVDLRAVAAHLAGFHDVAERCYRALENRLLSQLGLAILARERGDQLEASVGLQRLFLEYPTLKDFLVTGTDGEHWARALEPELHLDVLKLDPWRMLWKPHREWIALVAASPGAVADRERLRDLATEYQKTRSGAVRDRIAREFDRLRNPVRLRTRELAAGKTG